MLLIVVDENLIFHEGLLESDLAELKNKLSTFFKTDPRFCSHDIDVYVEFEKRYWLGRNGCVLKISVVNLDKVVEYGDVFAEGKRFATATVVYVCDNREPILEIHDGYASYWYKFELGVYTSTDCVIWEVGDAEGETVEGVIIGKVLEFGGSE